MLERTPYQDKVIKRYYDNRSDIMKQKLSELTTDLYLAEGKKRQQIWKRITLALTNLGIDPICIERLNVSDNPTLLAEFLEKTVYKK
ncbi:MAG: hypothetical protein LBI18_04965 [Planctomycetaceae bacterium]|jgi:hypothetical protein|nr:hypothetical protein [Planctomycetaceae bacterium]